MTLGFLDHMRVVPDRRIPEMVTYPLDEILLATLAGVVCGADDWEGVEEIATGGLDWLRLFLPLANGIPTAQTLRKVFRLLDAQALERGFAAWATSMRAAAREVIAVDGQPVADRPDPGRAADRHDGPGRRPDRQRAGGDLGRRLTGDRRSERGPDRGADARVQRGGDGRRLDAHADAQRRRGRDLRQRFGHQRLDLRLHRGGRTEHGLARRHRRQPQRGEDRQHGGHGQSLADRPDPGRAADRHDCPGRAGDFERCG